MSIASHVPGNVADGVQWCETENPLWGLTTHPVNPTFTPGGSSGGEGALLSLHGSLIGFGTDIGGSIRIPSHMNGLWGLKPCVSSRKYCTSGRTLVLTHDCPEWPHALSGCCSIY